MPFPRVGWNMRRAGCSPGPGWHGLTARSAGVTIARTPVVDALADDGIRDLVNLQRAIVGDIRA